MNFGGLIELTKVRSLVVLPLFYPIPVLRLSKKDSPFISCLFFDHSPRNTSLYECPFTSNHGFPFFPLLFHFTGLGRLAILPKVLAYRSSPFLGYLQTYLSRKGGDRETLQANSELTDNNSNAIIIEITQFGFLESNVEKNSMNSSIFVRY